jgi:hypothetical protein
MFEDFDPGQLHGVNGEIGELPHRWHRR